MSFLFGKSKKNQSSALPAASREITSSYGPESRIPTANGLQAPRDGSERRATTQNQTPGSSVNSSMNSVQGMISPEPGQMRTRAESDVMNVRSGSVRTLERATDSPYPWSQRRLEFTAGVSPFPRYGAAINATASKEGWIYLMGGLINGTMVKGDLWMVEVASGRMGCFPIATDNGPSPRVGHASLLVGNAFIVFGGDTKLEDGDVLDDTLYLLNTSTKQWSRASPAGTRPAGRYGHTLNILGSRIFIFGGQVEGYFFNDLIAFDLNTLKANGNRWEVMIPNAGDGQAPIPPPRTNHSVVTWQDKLYLFGGTDGNRWFNDVWTYDPRTNTWSELDCIGYIPAPREGHAAALVNDTMYVFGGRVQDGSDLGDLAAFRISTRRWYMFQNMGMSPSPRSGHSMTAYGKHIIVLGGEPSSAPRDINELSWSYVLDTAKIRYPPTEQPTQQQAQQQPVPSRKFSGERPTGIPQSKATGISVSGGQQLQYRGSETSPTGGSTAQTSRLPRTAGSGGSSMQPPQQGRVTGTASSGNTPRSRTPTQAPKQSAESTKAVQYERENVISGLKDPSLDNQGTTSSLPQTQQLAASVTPPAMASRTGSFNAPSRSGSRAARQQDSIDSGGRQTPKVSADASKRDINEFPVDSGVGSSPAPTQQNDEFLKELEAAKGRNAWYAAELALAKKAGYQPNSMNSPILDQQAADMFADDDRPLIEALLRMRQEIARIQGSMDQQAATFATRVAEVEKQRDAAVNEAAYAKAKLAGRGAGSQGGTPQPDLPREVGSPDLDRADDMARRLATTLKQNNDLSTKLDTLSTQLEAERKARQLAEDAADAAQRRVSELDSYRQVTSSEVESLRAELHDAQRTAREEAASCAQARSALELLEADQSELYSRHAAVQEEYKAHDTVLQTLREAVNASADKTSLLERKLEEERDSRSAAEQKLAQIKIQCEERTIELEAVSRRLRDADELAEKYAHEARTHREAVLSGLNTMTSRSVGQDRASDQRIAVLYQQLESANSLAQKNKDAADAAANRLRSAEERIAGLEAYQEQASRDSLMVRKQLQAALRDVQVSQAEKNEMQRRTERNALESNALQVQLSTLKSLLEERGISAADVRRSRVLESPSSRYGTPELNRVRELERQLDESVKSHEELRLTFEQREQEVAREWEEKLAALDNDHQGAVKYVRGLEKMLAKMKQELQRTKSTNLELEKELAQRKYSGSVPDPESSTTSPAWEQERENMRAQISEMQANVKSSVAALESQIGTLNAALTKAETERATLQQASQESQVAHEAQMRQLTERARSDLDALRHENALLEDRAREAEHKVQMFLDQFENSVDNYRRISRMTQQDVQGSSGHRHHDSIAGESLYSTATDTDEDDRASIASGEVTPSAHSFPTTGLAGSIDPPSRVAETLSRHERDRSSTALDGLASELEALRTHWETTNKNYRLGDKFEFERSPLSPSSTLAGSLGLGLGVSAGGPGEGLPSGKEREGMSESLAS